ncbi:MAG: hypothetical protein M3P53_04130 [Actinomycetota bacterium]|nr:hypothetical protein [Actinomycetota bacterium]
MIPSDWLHDGERDLRVVGDGYLQGIVLAESSASTRAAATEQRILMFDPGVDATSGTARLVFQVPWASVVGYWTGVLPLPAELWREGPRGEVVVLMLDPEVAGGQDVVIRSNLEAWIAAIRQVGVPQVVD